MRRIFILILIFLILLGGSFIYLMLTGRSKVENENVGEEITQDLGSKEIELSVEEDVELIVDRSKAKLAPEKFFFTVSGVNPGKDIIVDSISFEEPGYIVIFSDKDGKPSKVFAFSDLLDAGIYSDLSIGLPKEIKIDEIYYVVIYADDGDGIFEVPGDDVPLVNNKNSPILKRIEVKT